MSMERLALHSRDEVHDGFVYVHLFRTLLHDGFLHDVATEQATEDTERHDIHTHPDLTN